MYQVGIYSKDENERNAIENSIVDKYPFKVYKFQSESELCLGIAGRTGVWDILLLDIENVREHISIVREIQERDSHIKIIFIIGNAKDVSDVFEAEPTYLLLKPFSKGKLSRAMDKAVVMLEEEKKQMLRLHFKEKMICIPYQEILYLESDLRYLIIHKENGTDKVIMKLSEIMARLPEYFIRCHQSYVVNINRIVKFERNGIVIEDGRRIAVSRKRYQETKRAVEKFYPKWNEKC